MEKGVERDLKKWVLEKRWSLIYKSIGSIFFLFFWRKKMYVKKGERVGRTEGGRG